MKCPYCGKEISDNANFCPKCGQKQSKEKENFSMKTTSGNKKWLILLIIAVAAVAVIIAVVNQTKKPPVNSGEKSQTKTESQKNQPEAESMKGQKKAGEKSLKTQLEAGGEKLDLEDPGTRIAELIYQNASWEIKSVENGTAVIAISAPDFYTLYTDLTKDAPTPKDADEYKTLIEDLESSLEKNLSQGNYSQRTREVSVPVADDGTITVTSELTDALYGGLLTLTEELRNTYMGGEY